MPSSPTTNDGAEPFCSIAKAALSHGDVVPIPTMSVLAVSRTIVPSSVQPLSFADGHEDLVQTVLPLNVKLCPYTTILLFAAFPKFISSPNALKFPPVSSESLNEPCVAQSPPLCMVIPPKTLCPSTVRFPALINFPSTRVVPVTTGAAISFSANMVSPCIALPTIKPSAKRSRTPAAPFTVMFLEKNASSSAYNFPCAVNSCISSVAPLTSNFFPTSTFPSKNTSSYVMFPFFVTNASVKSSEDKLSK